ncbi:hypothetical protein ACFYRY_40225 [Streptomyces sp. NPDC005263]|uniref:hypothetical protein n=1 Tax=Streptomyces sp. NPDC005263 TaxID=3364711 RepID=UPI0036AEFB0A
MAHVAARHCVGRACGFVVDLGRLLQDEHSNPPQALARHLHDAGVFEGAIGKPVPVVLHELDYYDGIARRTEAANPLGLADAVTAWVRNG